MHKKVWLLLALTVLCALLLCACGECEHDWQAATCSSPKTCRLCGTTEGETLPHTFAEADCATAKTCTACGATEGAPLGHVWHVATCETAQTCSVCGATAGEALGHSWVEATCESPKTCSVCAATEGEALGHVFADYVDCENPPKCGNCGIYSTEPTAHSWVEATCETAKTCSACGATEGAPKGHEWYAATCETPKTCAACGKTEGEALGHTWSDATCETAKTCATCGATDGEALGHDWVDATTEAPKTCATCGATEGQRIITDSRFHTDACKHIFGNWETTGSASYTSADGEVVYVSYNMCFTFTNDGRWIVTKVYNLEEYKYYLQVYTVDYMYEVYGEKGYTKEELDAAMVAQYGMNVQEYVASLVAGYTQEDATDVTEYVYYVEGSTIYVAENWTDAFGHSDYAVEGDVLYIYEDDGEQMVLVKEPVPVTG